MHYETTKYCVFCRARANEVEEKNSALEAEIKRLKKLLGKAERKFEELALEYAQRRGAMSGGAGGHSDFASATNGSTTPRSAAQGGQLGGLFQLSSPTRHGSPASLPPSILLASSKLENENAVMRQKFHEMTSKLLAADKELAKVTADNKRLAREVARMREDAALAFVASSHGGASSSAQSDRTAGGGGEGGGGGRGGAGGGGGGRGDASSSSPSTHRGGGNEGGHTGGGHPVLPPIVSVSSLEGKINSLEKLLK